MYNVRCTMFVRQKTVLNDYVFSEIHFLGIAFSIARSFDFYTFKTSI